MKIKNVLIFFAFLIPALIVVLAIKRQHAVKLYFQDGDRQMENWAAQKFEPINNDGNFLQLLNTIPIQNKVILDNEMTDSLHEAVNNFFMAYHEGDIDSFKRFHMPTGKGHYDPELLKWRIVDMKVAGAVPVTTNLQNGDEIFNDYWEKVGAKQFSQFFQGLCIEQSELSVSYTNSSSSLEQMLDLKNFNKTARQFGVNLLRSPTFISDPQPEPITQQFGKIYIATLKSLVKNSDNIAYPILCVWYYSPNDNKWIPYTIGTRYEGTQKQKTHLVF